MLEKRWRFAQTNEKQVQFLQSNLGIPPLICRMLVQRDICTPEAVKDFFNPHFSQLHDPFLLKDMEKAVSRLYAAIKKNEKILLYGDYDVDGTTSIALMYTFLAPLVARLDYYIPDRYKEGYGISMPGIDYAIENKVGLIIAMDCGITAMSEVAYADDAGIDMIIVDHHIPGAQLPEALAVLDPKRKDCSYPYKELSACALSFKLIQALSDQLGFNWLDLEPLLDFVAMSIACDIVPMTGENRVLAYYGLKTLNKTRRPGLKALLRKSQRRMPLLISDVVFGLGPRINAAGRMADAEQAVKLLLSKRDDIAEDHARVLDYRNSLRKEFDERMAREAEALFLEQSDWRERRSIVLYQPHWHKGVLGIVASRMVERFHRPTILLTESDGMAVGSARSINGFDLYKALEKCENLLVNFGGHQHAAGLKLHTYNVQAFADRLESIAFAELEADQLIAEIPVASELLFSDIKPSFLKLLKQFAPFGPGNRRPVFVSRNVFLSGHSSLLKGKHIKMSLQQKDAPKFQAIAFGMGACFDELQKGNSFDICYTLEENYWKGKTKLQLMVKDFKY